MKKYIVLLLVVALFPAIASAQSTLKAVSDDKKQYIVNELAAETTQCWSFYSIVGACASNGDTPIEKQTAEQMNKLASSLVDPIYTMSKAAGMKDDAILARMKLSVDDMKGDISNNGDTSKSCVNISILMGKYMKSCKTIIEHPEIRIQELVKANP